MNQRLQKIQCPLCKSPKFTHIVTRVDKLDIVHCQECELAYVNPRPISEDITKMYEEDYYTGSDDKSFGYSNRIPSAVNIKYIPPYGWELLVEETSLANMRTLDIGCAFGHWVYWKSKAGARATGIDLAPDGIKWGRGKLNLDLRQTTLELLNEPDESFDVITVIDLIEHVLDLESFMNQVVSLLKPGGLVFVQTPNFGTYKKWKNRCIHLKISLEHMLYFEIASLDKLFGKYGMQPSRKTQVLRTIPCDIESYLMNRKKVSRGLKSQIRKIPGVDFIRLVRLKLQKPIHVYRYDESGQNGAAIIGCYRKEAN